MARRRTENEICCPFIDENDSRCACRFSLCHLHEAMNLCMDSYWHCPTYYQLRLERAGEWICLTIGGKPLEAVN